MTTAGASARKHSNLAGESGESERKKEEGATVGEVEASTLLIRLFPCVTRTKRKFNKTQVLRFFFLLLLLPVLSS